MGGRRWVRYGWVLLCLVGIAAILPAAVAAQEIRTLQIGEFLADAAPALPDDADPRWQPVQLPDVWQPPRFDHGSAGWYRFHVDLPDVGARPWALYFPRLGINGAVWVNGVPAGDGGPFDEPMAFHSNHSLLFTLPAPLLHPGDNLIHVYLKGYPYFTGLPPFDVGPLQPLERRHERRLTLQNHAAFGLMLLTFTAFAFGLTLWGRNRDQPVYFWFSLAAAFWTLYCANIAFSSLPIAGYWRLALTHSGMVWSCAAQLIFVHRFIEARRAGLERLALAVAVLATLINLFGGWWALRYVGSALELLGLASIAYCVLYAVARWQYVRGVDVLLLCAGLCLELLLAARDFMLFPGQATGEYRDSLSLMHFAAPVFLYAMAWRLVDRSLGARRELDQLNRGLEERVARARAELEHAYGRRYELEREQATLEERERIHRDLHDDLGAKLLTLIHAADNRSSADLARAALADLREVVALNPEDSVSLRGALSDMESDTLHHASCANSRVEWRYPPDCDSLEVPSGFAFHLGRILREAVRNALHHGAASTVAVAFSLDRGHLSLQVCDRGRGIGDSQPGHGMRSMQARAELLRGTVRWLAADHGGTVVEIHVPLPSH